MTTTTNQRAIDLMPQLRDLFDLAATHDLPHLAHVGFSASNGDDGWTAEAQLSGLPTSEARWEALLAWGHGTAPVLGEPVNDVPGGYWPSGTWRQASVTVVVAEVSVKIWAHLDGLFVPPQPVPVHVTGPFAGLLLGGDA